MRNKQRAFTLIEVVVVIAIFTILVGVSVPYYFRYRAHQAVNTAQEQIEGLLLRTKEEAKSIGIPLDKDKLSDNGAYAVNTVNKQGRNGDIIIRIRKRTASQVDPTPQTIAERNLSQAAKLEISAENLGKVDLDSVQTLKGVYFEILIKDQSSLELLATVPIDINSETVLTTLNSAEKGKITLYSDDYSRSVMINNHGAVTKDRY